LPPKAVAGRPGFTRAKRPRLQSPPADRWAAIQNLALAPSLLLGATSPIRNSKEPGKHPLAKDVRPSPSTACGEGRGEGLRLTAALPVRLKVDLNEFDYGFQYKRIRTDTSDKDRLWTVGRVCLWPNGLFTGNHVEFRAKRVGSPEELGCGICDSRA